MKSNSLKIAALISSVFLFIFTANAQINDDSNKANKNDKKQEKLENSEKSNDDSDCPPSARVRLRVTFDKSGEITKAEIVLSGGCRSFDEEALKAAKKIKFVPAKKNGKKITVVKQVEYTFNKDN